MARLVRWYKVECTCGETFYWSRTEEKDIELLKVNGGTLEPLCSDCSSFNDGFDRGVKSAVETIERFLLNKTFVSGGAKIKIKSWNQQKS